MGVHALEVFFGASGLYSGARMSTALESRMVGSLHGNPWFQNLLNTANASFHEMQRLG